MQPHLQEQENCSTQDQSLDLGVRHPEHPPYSRIKWTIPQPIADQPRQPTRTQVDFRPVQLASASPSPAVPFVSLCDLSDLQPWQPTLSLIPPCLSPIIFSTVHVL
ncbi:hypothetical protein Pcinc_035104 [Petrolisthes cinctipes]|uniref:Uncharacterized protein n=1 Tax=Petrolisthes cinctipes TaxID=88211 RepID=A0AAE1BX61_PETCI|nr:hypothetical protein Pcinc_035104 [Petrolisthes cinctipes]